MEKIYGIRVDAKWHGLSENPSRTVKKVYGVYTATSCRILIRAANEIEAFRRFLKPVSGGGQYSAFKNMPKMKGSFVEYHLLDSKCGKELARETGFTMKQLEKLVGED